MLGYSLEPPPSTFQSVVLKGGHALLLGWTSVLSLVAPLHTPLINHTPAQLAPSSPPEIPLISRTQHSSHSVHLLTSLLSVTPLPFTSEFGVRFQVSAVWKKQKMSLPHPRVKVNIVGSLCDREVACSASDRQGSNFESCVWRIVSSQSSHYSQEVLLAQLSLYVHKGGLKPDSFLISHTRHSSHPVHVLPSLLLVAPHTARTQFTSWHLSY